MTISHDDAIEWPNGAGFTPCSKQYADLHQEMARLKPDDVNLDDLEPSDYNKYCSLEHDLGALQLDGHLGSSVRY